jgi:uncharacterized membrane protein
VTVSEYLARLAAALRMRGRARSRALAEVEDHLREAAVHDPEEAVVERFGPPEELARALDAEHGHALAGGAATTVAFLALLYGLELLALAALGLWRQPAFEVHVVRGWAAPPVHLLAALTQGKTIVWATALAAAAGALALTRFSSGTRGARIAIGLSTVAAALLLAAAVLVCATTLAYGVFFPTRLDGIAWYGAQLAWFVLVLALAPRALLARRRALPLLA